MRINDPKLKQVLNDETLKISVLGSIVGKYIYLEVPYGESIAAEEIENENGEILYFKTEQEAYDKIEELKNN